MEITLEKIELVKDRTGVSYKEAKEALEAADGSVVDAIIAIEETIDVKKSSKANDIANDTIEKIKELVKKGNISKISVKKDDEVIVNIPLNVGIVGTLVAPWGVIAAAIAAFGFKCKIELTTTDGNVINVSQRAGEFASSVAEKGSVVIDEVVAKGNDFVNDVKEKAPDAFNEVKAKGTETYNNIKDAATGKYNEIKSKKNDASGIIDDLDLDGLCDDIGKQADILKDKAEDALDKFADKAEDAAGKFADKIEDVFDKDKE